MPADAYGSMLKPGVGRLVETPTAPTSVVVAGLGNVWVPNSPVRATPPRMLTATGSRLPPITRNATVPPNVFAFSVALSASQLANPADTVSVPSPRDARAPYA